MFDPTSHGAVEYRDRATHGETAIHALRTVEGVSSVAQARSLEKVSLVKTDLSKIRARISRVHGPVGKRMETIVPLIGQKHK